MDIEQEFIEPELTAEKVTTKVKPRGMAINLVDPLGICNGDLGMFKYCDNIGQSKGIKRIIMIIAAIGLVILGDLFDMLSWVVGLIPVWGDILGNAVIGNIIDGIVFILLLFLIGFPAFFGIGEFIDVLSFIPVIGDIASLIEWLPAWTFAIIIYAVLKLISSASSPATMQLTGLLGLGGNQQA